MWYSYTMQNLWLGSVNNSLNWGPHMTRACRNVLANIYNNAIELHRPLEQSDFQYVDVQTEEEEQQILRDGLLGILSSPFWLDGKKSPVHPIKNQGFFSFLGSAEENRSYDVREISYKLQVVNSNVYWTVVLTDLRELPQPNVENTAGFLSKSDTGLDFSIYQITYDTEDIHYWNPQVHDIREWLRRICYLSAAAREDPQDPQHIAVLLDSMRETPV